MTSEAITFQICSFYFKNILRVIIFHHHVRGINNTNSYTKKFEMILFPGNCQKGWGY